MIVALLAAATLARCSDPGVKCKLASPPVTYQGPWPPFYYEPEQWGPPISHDGALKLAAPPCETPEAKAWAVCVAWRVVDCRVDQSAAGCPVPPLVRNVAPEPK